MNRQRTVTAVLLACGIALVDGSCSGNDDSAGPSTTTGTSAPTVGAACGAAPGRSDIVVTGGGFRHSVRIHVPPGASGSDVLPTVLSWHGLGETGDDTASYDGLERLADVEGFVVVHPTGAASPGLPVLETGPGWELVDALDTPDRDDIAFASSLIDELEANWCADPDRIYSIGISNGGMFTSTLVCGLNDRLAAAASVAGVYHADTCDPADTVPYIAFHGTDDGTVPYATGGATIVPELRDSILALGAFDAYAAFATGSGCEEPPTPVVLTDAVTRHDYVGCDGDTPMSFYELKGLGHVWPGVAGAPITGDFDATDEAWRFFEQHSRVDR